MGMTRKGLHNIDILVPLESWAGVIETASN